MKDLRTGNTYLCGRVRGRIRGDRGKAAGRRSHLKKRDRSAFGAAFGQGDQDCGSGGEKCPGGYGDQGLAGAVFGQERQAQPDLRADECVPQGVREALALRGIQVTVTAVYRAERDRYIARWCASALQP